MSALVAAPSQASQAVTPREGPAGGIGLRLVDVPTAGAQDPRAHLYVIDHMAPGTEIERRVEITNSTASQQDIDLYAAAATLEDGGFVGAEGKSANELSAWTVVTPDRSEVPAGGTALASVTIAIPADASPGERYGVVWAEVRSADTAAGGVVQVSRVGIRLYVSVGPGGAPAPDFEIESLIASRSASGNPTISASVHNTGGRALDLRGELSLDGGPGGLRAGPFAADLGTTLGIDDRQLVTIPLDERLPAGPWDVHITLVSGLVERTSVATVTFPASGSETVLIAPSTPERPWLALGVLSVLLIAVCADLVRRRHAGPLPEGRHLIPVGARH
jgi:hypothetical protein